MPVARINPLCKICGRPLDRASVVEGICRPCKYKQIVEKIEAAVENLNMREGK